MNKFIGLGSLVKDNDLRATQSGKNFVNNTLAIKNTFKNANGEYGAEFVDFQVWGNQAETLARYTSKGDQVLIEGRLQKRSYETDNGTRYITEIVCDRIQFVSTKGDKEDNRSVQDVRNDVFKDFGDNVVNKSQLHEDEDVPF